MQAMRNSNFLYAVLALAVGVAAGYVLGGKRSTAVPEAVGEAKVAPKVDLALVSSERALSARIRELEAMYKAAPVPEKAVIEDDGEYWEPFVSTNADGVVSYSISLLGGGFAFDLKKQLEELREKDPAEFASRVKFRRQMADQIADEYDQRIRFFEQLDTDWMSESERADFDQFVAQLKTASDVSRRGGKWDLPFEQRKLVDAYAFRTAPTIPQAYPKIRAQFLKQTTAVMGLTGEAAEDFMATVNDVERLTSRYAAVSLPPERKR